MSLEDFGGLWECERVESKFLKLERIYRSKEKRDLFVCIVKTFASEFWLALILNMVASCFSYTAPFLVHRIITFLESDDKNTNDGLTLLGALIGA